MSSDAEKSDAYIASLQLKDEMTPEETLDWLAAERERVFAGGKPHPPRMVRMIKKK